MQIESIFDEHVVKSTISRAILEVRLHQIFKDISIEDFVRIFTNEFEQLMQYFELCNEGKTCQKMSLLFNPHRLEVKGFDSRMSVYDAIKTRSYCDNLARALLFKQSQGTKDLLYSTIQIGVAGIQYINEFPPHVARMLCKEFYINANSLVLDPCAGWGGRMIGVSTVCNNYHCFDPSTKTFNGLIKLSQFLNKLDGKFRPAIGNTPFEDSNLPANYYDFALTSPPYYNTELYSSEETNSCNRYGCFEHWCEGFYLPLISKVMYSLKPGKAFILNIGSRKYPLDTVLKTNFGEKYEIVKKGNYYLSAPKNGLKSSKGDGETFYAITKPL